MDRNFNILIKEKRAKEQYNKEEGLRDSHDKLKTTIEKKMTTVMVGALSAVEEQFEFLWTGDEDDDNVAYMKSLFQELRNNIFELGNKQIKAMKNELDLYSVEWIGYIYNMKVKGREQKNDEG